MTITVAEGEDHQVVRTVRAERPCRLPAGAAALRIGLDRASGRGQWLIYRPAYQRVVTVVSPHPGELNVLLVDAGCRLVARTGRRAVYLQDLDTAHRTVSGRAT